MNTTFRSYSMNRKRFRLSLRMKLDSVSSVIGRPLGSGVDTLMLLDIALMFLRHNTWLQ
jgi:hypothetical protein